MAMEAPQPAAARALLAAVAVLLTGAVFFGGGSGHDSVWWIGLGVVGVLTLVVSFGFAGRFPLPALGRAEIAFATALIGFVAWQGVSVAWSVAPDRSWDAFDKELVLLGFLGLGLVVGAVVRPSLVAVVLAVVLGAALVWALAGRAIPAFFEDGERIARLRNPVGYWNGLALLGDFALALGLWLGTVPRTRPWRRVAGALLIYAAAAVILLTLSRTGVVAGVAAVAVWLVLCDRRVEGALLAIAGTVPAALLAAFAYARPALVDDGQPHSDRVREGAIFGVLALLGAAVVAGLVVWGLRRGLARRVEVARWLVGGGAVVAAAALVALVVAVGNPVSWATDQFKEGGPSSNSPGRLLEAGGNNRWQWWQEAADVWRADPVVGAGANTFEIARKRYREDSVSVSQPHSVPVQALSDGGVIGLALLVVVVLAGVSMGEASLRRLDGEERAAAATLVVLPAAWVLHAIADYDLDFLATTAPPLLALGVVGAAGRPVRLVRRPLWAVGAVALALGVATSLGAPPLADRAVRQATDALEAGEPAAAVSDADRARSLDPFALDPLFVLAGAEARRGDPAAALAALRRATRLQPDNSRTWEELGRYEFSRGDLCSAYRDLNEAYTRDPNGSQWRPAGELDRARAHVNAGRCG